MPASHHRLISRPTSGARHAIRLTNTPRAGQHYVGGFGNIIPIPRIQSCMVAAAVPPHPAELLIHEEALFCRAAL